jgi:hypothetical protein
MALNRYVITSAVTVPAGPASAVVAGEPGTGGAVGYGNGSTTAAGWTTFPLTFQLGTPIILDPASPPYVYLNARACSRPGCRALTTWVTPRSAT